MDCAKVMMYHGKLTIVDVTLILEQVPIGSVLTEKGRTMAKAEAWVMIPKLDEKKTGCVLDMRLLVLCKECRYLSSPADGVPFCEHIKKFVDSNWFCADGERR